MVMFATVQHSLPFYQKNGVFNSIPSKELAIAIESSGVFVYAVASRSRGFRGQSSNPTMCTLFSWLI